MTRYACSHARAAAWVLAATLLFGWEVAGCNDTSTKLLKDCGTRGGVFTETLLPGDKGASVSILCGPFVDAGTR